MGYLCKASGVGFRISGFIVPLKLIEYGFGLWVYSEKIPIYPIFYLLKGDCRVWGLGFWV